MSSEKRSNIGRDAFVQRFCRDCNLSYTQALQVHDAMVSVFEDAITNAERVVIGQIGALTPRRLPPRVVRMGFKRTREGVTKNTKEFVIGERVKYGFNIFRRFFNTHSFNW